MKQRPLISILIAFLFVQTGVVYAYAQQQVDEEYLVKAVFFERFSRFIEWPPEAELDSPGVPFVIGVIGDNPFGSLLDTLYATKSIKNKQVEVRYLASIDEIKNCHLLYIAQNDKNRLKEILRHSSSSSVLTIADSMGFGQRGVGINMYLEDGQIRFEINNKALSKSGFIVSSLLLKVARVVHTAEKVKR